MNCGLNESGSELNKGLGKFTPGGRGNWNILAEDVSLPAACVIQPTVQYNIDWMATFASTFAVQLCPHVKTTMCPKLIQMQMAKGVWGLTTATVQQTVVVHHFGAKRILMANQLVGKSNMQIISDILMKDSQFEFYCVVDSVENVKDLASFFGHRKQKLKVLLEIGIDGGRTGIRNPTALGHVLKTLKTVEGTLVLCGVEFYEGVVQTEVEVRAFCKKAFEALLHVISTLDEWHRDEFSPQEVIISGAGSAWFDIVAQEINAFRHEFFQKSEADSRELVPVLRPGCYIVHDVGMYKEVEARISKTQFGLKHLVLKPALKVIAYVQSRPEPTLAIIGMGKRDVAIDCDFPSPFQYWRNDSKMTSSNSGTSTLNSVTSISNSVTSSSNSGTSTSNSVTSTSNSVTSTEGTKNRKWMRCPETWKITKVMDQHAFLKIPEDESIRTGDIMCFDISHPCNTFTAWRQILIVDENYNVLEIAPTFF